MKSQSCGAVDFDPKAFVRRNILAVVHPLAKASATADFWDLKG